jgi:hypothetical protein
MAKQLCPARGHPEGRSSVPWYEIRQDKVYPARGHPDGRSSVPHYEIKGQ